jgi:hypothetical protein
MAPEQKAPEQKAPEQKAPEQKVPSLGEAAVAAMTDEQVEALLLERLDNP